MAPFPEGVPVRVRMEYLEQGTDTCIVEVYQLVVSDNSAKAVWSWAEATIFDHNTRFKNHSRQRHLVVVQILEPRKQVGT